jgi:iron(III) transport system substrate-binding protein
MNDMNSNRRRFLRGSAAVAGTALLGALRPGSAIAAEQKTMTLYSGQHSNTTTALVNAFTKATGIKVEVRKGHSAQLANQIIEEGERSPADVFYSEESPPVVVLAEKGRLAKLPADTLQQIPARYVARDGTWVGVSARSRVVAYNTTMIDKAQLPKSVLDFATPAWKGKVAYVPTSGAFQEQIIAIELLKGRTAALDWLKGLKAYGAPYNGNMAAMRAVEAGEIATALINDYYWFSLAAEVGAQKMKSALYYIGHKDPGALITVSAAGVLKSARHPSAAQQLLAFMVSAAGQTAIADTVAEYPLRPGVKSPFALKPFNEIEPPDVTPADLGDAADALVLRRAAGLA